MSDSIWQLKSVTLNKNRHYLVVVEDQFGYMKAKDVYLSNAATIVNPGGGVAEALYQIKKAFLQMGVIDET